MTDLGEDKAYEVVRKKLFAKLLKLQSQVGDELDLKTVYPQLSEAKKR